MATTQEILDVARDRMGKAASFLTTELQSIRAGRANPHLLDNIRVDYYGTPTPIAQVGNVSAPEPRLLMISPWDVSLIQVIEKAIQVSDLGINPQNDGKVIRLMIPELTEERRKDLVKTVRKRGEDSKVAVRNVRRDTLEQLKALEKEHTISEDELRREEDSVQKITNEYIAQVDEIIRDKEKEILSV